MLCVIFGLNVLEADNSKNANPSAGREAPYRNPKPLAEAFNRRVLEESSAGIIRMNNLFKVTIAESRLKTIRHAVRVAFERRSGQFTLAGCRHFLPALI